MGVAAEISRDSRRGLSQVGRDWLIGRPKSQDSGTVGARESQDVHVRRSPVDQPEQIHRRSPDDHDPVLPPIGLEQFTDTAKRQLDGFTARKRRHNQFVVGKKQYNVSSDDM
jgi:hypothetical protein